MRWTNYSKKFISILSMIVYSITQVIIECALLEQAFMHLGSVPLT
jgi:hypothetical protein